MTKNTLEEAESSSITMAETSISYVFLLFLLIASSIISSASTAAILDVKYKFAVRERPLSDLKAYDDHRILRLLTGGIDLPLGGSGCPDNVGFYYAKIGIGTPSKDYYLQVDTGSDIMWVNCIQSKECPRRSSLGIDLTMYDIKSSNTGKVVSCDQDFCYAINGGPLSGCTANASCPYIFWVHFCYLFVLTSTVIVFLGSALWPLHL